MWPRPWVVFIRFSVRVSDHFTGPAELLRDPRQETLFGVDGDLARRSRRRPRARSRGCGSPERPRHCATDCFTRCGTCVEVQSVSFCGPSSQCASTARPSIETGATRWFTSSSFTTPSASANSFSTSGLFAARHVQRDVVLVVGVDARRARLERALQVDHRAAAARCRPTRRARRRARRSGPRRSPPRSAGRPSARSRRRAAGARRRVRARAAPRTACARPCRAGRRRCTRRRRPCARARATASILSIFPAA